MSQESNGARPADRRIGGTCDRNAIYRATGKRMRDLPIAAQKLLWGARGIVYLPMAVMVIGRG